MGNGQVKRRQEKIREMPQSDPDLQPACLIENKLLCGYQKSEGFSISLRCGAHIMGIFRFGLKMRSGGPAGSVFGDSIVRDGYEIFHFSDLVDSLKPFLE